MPQNLAPWHIGTAMADATITATADAYLSPGRFIDSDHPAVQAFAQRTTAGAATVQERAVRLYFAVRDEILYDPYFVGEAERFYRASDCLAAGRGFCIPKAALLAAAARVLGIPARVGYADVRNHLSTRKLTELLGSDLFVWHGYTELHLETRWVKVTPAFNLTLCNRFGVRPLDFDGAQDALLHPYDQEGRRHMEYIAERGDFTDVPFDAIVAGFRSTYPRWLDLVAQGPKDDFAAEATIES